MRKKVAIILTIIAIICLGIGTGTLWKTYTDIKKEDEKSEEQVEKVKNIIENNENKNEESNESVQINEPNQPLDLNRSLGVLYIPSYNNFEHVIAAGVDNDTLTNYIGMYTTFSEPGQDGLCILAAHSTRWAFRQKYVFFNRIEDKVKVGDDVSILWKDGNTYHYKVTKIDSWVPENQEEDYFLNYDIKEKQTLILQTCTHGDGNYRSFIVCDRI